MTASINYQNSNGLVNGRIPKGNACPFLSECGLKNERCPTKEKPNLEHDYSCAAARGWSLVQIHDNKQIRAILGKPTNP